MFIFLYLCLSFLFVLFLFKFNFKFCKFGLIFSNNFILFFKHVFTCELISIVYLWNQRIFNEKENLEALIVNSFPLSGSACSPRGYGWPVSWVILAQVATRQEL